MSIFFLCIFTLIYTYYALLYTIERCLKTEFESRPVYLRRNDRIIAHFITCFLALLIFKTLKLKLEKPDLTTSALRKTLIGMDYLKSGAKDICPSSKAMTQQQP